MKKGSIDLSMQELLLLVLGVVVGWFFLQAANSFVNGYAVDKLYVAGDEVLLIDTLYSVPGNVFVNYNSSFVNEIKDNTLSVKENDFEPTKVTKRFVPIGDLDMDLEIKDNLVIQYFGGHLAISNTFPGKYTRKIKKSFTNKKIKLDKVYYINENELDIALLLDNSLLVKNPKDEENVLNVFLREGEKPKGYFPSKESISNYDLLQNIRTRLFVNEIIREDLVIIPKDDLEYENSIILELPDVIASFQYIQLAVAEFYDVE